MVQKIGRGGTERGEEEKEEEEEDEEEDEEDEEDEQEEEDEKDERGRGRSEEERGGEGGGGGGESVENLVRGDSFKAKAKLNQNKAKSTKHAGRPADIYIYICIMYAYKQNIAKHWHSVDYTVFVYVMSACSCVYQRSSIGGCCTNRMRVLHAPTSYEM